MIEVHDLHRHFGGFRAVNGASLNIRKGSITGLIGPNGAGKTTLFNVIAGVLPPTSGRVLMGGEDITGLAPHQLFHKGLLRTFQMAHEFGSMTVRENLMMVPPGQSGETLWNTWFGRKRIADEERALCARADEVLDFLTISHVAEEKAGNLSGGQKKLLELGRCMMVDARIVFLDEVGAGVNRTLLMTIADAILRLNRERGYTFCVIEHDMDFIGKLCDPVIVMAEGKVLAEGPADSIMANEAVIEAYLGRGLKNKVKAEAAEETLFGESHGFQPGLGDEAGAGGDGLPARPQGGI
ncbi:MAG TPA: ABC transporter ATP-binding protein [Paracoccus sp.]|nr:ABC transporter ATP-binding protein [Paracoccus sp. (in: a-proteobacteria)]